MAKQVKQAKRGEKLKWQVRESYRLQVGQTREEEELMRQQAARREAGIEGRRSKLSKLLSAFLNLLNFCQFLSDFLNFLNYQRSTKESTGWSRGGRH